jgi:hypothetical protein
VPEPASEDGQAGQPGGQGEQEPGGRAVRVDQVPGQRRAGRGADRGSRRQPRHALGPLRGIHDSLGDAVRADQGRRDAEAGDEYPGGHRGRRRHDRERADAERGRGERDAEPRVLSGPPAARPVPQAREPAAQPVQPEQRSGQRAGVVLGGEGDGRQVDRREQGAQADVHSDQHPQPRAAQHRAAAAHGRPGCGLAAPLPGQAGHAGHAQHDGGQHAEDGPHPGDQRHDHDRPGDEDDLVGDPFQRERGV